MHDSLVVSAFMWAMRSILHPVPPFLRLKQGFRQPCSEIMRSDGGQGL